MKRLNIIVFLLGIISMHAQKDEQTKKVTWGIKAGLDFATFSGNITNADLSTRISFHVGTMAEIKISDNFSLQPEFLYTSKGSRNGDNTDNGIVLEYLELPIIAKYYVAKNFSLEAGPGIGFAYLATLGGSDPVISSEINRWDFGLNFGTSYKINGKFHVGMRYYLGLTNVNSSDGSKTIPTLPSDDFKNRTFLISIGYFFSRK
ncbi:porin family protein [Aureivirga marina]|uniref:porin family protein n=1 Tax=Aureivirga marina TaxID=1182451 RepID=UPI0018C96009|nr:porin family protein [Aureivirga marina]